MDSPRVVFLVCILLFLYFSPNNPQPSLNQRYEIERRFEQESHAAGVLRNASYDAFNPAKDKWLNLTGFGKHDGYEWEGLRKVKEKTRRDLSVLLGPEGTKSVGALLGIGREDGDKDAPDAGLASEEYRRVPVYKNITGRIQGEWIRSKLSDGLRGPAHLPNTTSKVGDAPGFRVFNRNITGTSGKVKIKLDEKLSEVVINEHGTARDINAMMTIKDELSSGDGSETKLYGIHFEDYGGVILTSASPKFAGPFALPQLALSDHTYALAQQLLNRTLSPETRARRSSDELRFFREDTWPAAPNDSPFGFPIPPHCEYVVYLQQYPVDRSNFYSPHPSKLAEDPGVLELVENELRFPTGATIPTAPEITMSMLVFSPDCGFILESKGPPEFLAKDGLHLQGPKLESYMNKARRYTFLLAINCAIQMLLLTRQLKSAATPSTVSRVSFNTIAMMAMGDGFVWFVLIIVGIFVDSIFLVLIPTSFFAFMCVGFFGMKFLIDIWTVQAPERREQERQNATQTAAARDRSQAEAPGGATAAAGAITPAGADTLPLPATARRPNDSGATPVILPPDQDLAAAEAEDNAATNMQTNPALDARSEISSLYMRFFFLLLGLCLLSINATSWPTTIRSFYTNSLVFLYFSFWLPQIYRNIMRNCRKALRWEFVIGQSVLRLLPVLYFYLIPNNILFVEPDSHAAYALAGWVWIQIWVLASQELLGPRFFIPAGWAPPAYDYHPVLREEDLEAGGGTSMPRGYTRAPSPSQMGSANAAPIGRSVSGAGEPSRMSSERAKRTFTCGVCLQDLEIGSGEGVLERRSYMLTPCGHIYHSPCLKAWADIRLVCPLCKEDLPPY